jgi:hypothetical protein
MMDFNFFPPARDISAVEFCVMRVELMLRGGAQRLSMF